MSIPTSIRLDEATSNKLSELAHTTGRSQSYYIREALERYIDDLIFEYRIQQSLQDARQGKNLVDIEELGDLLGLQD